MTRGVKKGAFAIDAQRGEGSAAREAALRGAPLLPEDEVQVNMERPADAPQTNIQAQAPQLGNVFAPSNDATPMMQQNPVFDEFEIVDFDKKTALNYAKDFQHTDVIRLLEKEFE